MTLPLNMDTVQPIVDAALYEGYILYPYRSSAAKNQQRWTFGGVYPQTYFEVSGGADPCHMQTQCLIEGDGDTRVEVRLRFLQPTAREVGQLYRPLQTWPETGEPAFMRVPSLVLGARSFYRWQEAVEREVALVDIRLTELLDTARRHTFAFDGGRALEPIADDDGWFKGVLVREHPAIRGRVTLGAQTVAKGVQRLTARIENHTAMDPDAIDNREQASLYAFASTHTVIGVAQGRFVSLMDPPDALSAAAHACDNQGAYPVLVGEAGARDMLLCSPIILYDYPEVAPESPGDLFDATEIDEILSLNILAMSADEKREMAATDPRAAALLARTEALDSDDFMRMHGVLREPRAIDARRDDAEDQALEPGVDRPRFAYDGSTGRQLNVGDRVRLHPRAGGDVWDVVLAGMTAVIESIEHDFDDCAHVAVTLDDDPGREWGMARMPGHRFFFSPAEIESLEPTSGTDLEAPA